MLYARKIKEDFPWFSSETGKKNIYADSAATTHKPKSVLDTMNALYTEYYAAVNRTSHESGEIFSEMYYDAHRRMASFIGAESADEIIFTRNCTDAINHAANALLRTTEPAIAIGKGDRIICTIMEHHSNMLPWQQLAQLTGAEIVYAGLYPDRTIDIDHFKSLINGRTRIAAFSHVSNVLGTVNHVAQLCSICRDAGVLTLIDGTQAAPHMRVNVSEIGCDFYAFSGHKMLAPSGTGVLWGRTALLEKLAPSFYGGGMISSVTTQGASWNSPPWKFEPGTPDACGAIALAGSEANGRRLYGAVDYLEAAGMDAVLSHEKELSAYTRKLLAEIEGVEFLCTEAHSGITAFRMAKKGREENSHIVGTLLNEMNIIARTGGHCAYPLHQYLDINDSGSIRLSYYIYNDKSDVEAICSALGSINLL